jgi:hypothetical protein
MNKIHMIPFGVQCERRCAGRRCFKDGGDGTAIQRCDGRRSGQEGTRHDAFALLKNGEGASTSYRIALSGES